MELLLLALVLFNAVIVVIALAALYESRRPKGCPGNCKCKCERIHS